MARRPNATGHYLNGLVQDCSNSIANALELLQSCIKPSVWLTVNKILWNTFENILHENRLDTDHKKI